MHPIELFLITLAVYLLIGVTFSIAFTLLGAKAIDQVAKTTSFGFKLLVLPASALLWPIMLAKWIRA